MIRNENTRNFFKSIFSELKNKFLLGNDIFGRIMQIYLTLFVKT